MNPKRTFEILITSGCFNQSFFSLKQSNSADNQYGKFTTLVIILLKPRIISFKVCLQSGWPWHAPVEVHMQSRCKGGYSRIWPKWGTRKRPPWEIWRFPLLRIWAHCGKFFIIWSIHSMEHVSPGNFIYIFSVVFNIFKGWVLLHVHICLAHQLVVDLVWYVIKGEKWHEHKSESFRGRKWYRQDDTPSASEIIPK